jgi:hypothetical protein
MLKTVVFWDVMSCSLADTDVFERPATKVEEEEEDSRLC